MNALITGASMGIGLELAKLFAQDKHNLILVARSLPKLEALATELRTAYGIQVWVVPQDLSRPGAAQEIYDQLAAEGLQVDVLVNNAGFGNHGEFARSDNRSNAEMVQVNCTVLMELTRLFLPAMIARGQGWIMNVGSTAAYQPGPLMAVYYATKAFVLSFSEAIANEVAGTGVTVTCLNPGPTRTGFADRADMHTTRLFSGKLLSVMDAAQVARVGYAAMWQGRRVVIPGAVNWLLAVGGRLVPRSLTARIAKLTAERA